MISTIRSQLKQTTYRYIIFFMVSVIALSMISSIFVKTERAGVAWAVRVNGVEIPYKEFAKEVAKQSQYLNRIKAQYGQYADLLFQSMGWSIDPKTRALDLLIKEELVRQYAEKIGLVLHAEYVAKVLNDAHFVKNNLGHLIPSFVFDQSGALDMNIVKNFLRQSGTSPQEFEKNIEQALIQYQLLNMISSSFYIPTFDIKQEFITKHLSKQFSYLIFSFDQYLAQEKKINVTDEELQIFYDNQNTQLRRYWVPEKRNGMMWKFEPKNYNIAVSDEEIQEYYEDNKIKNYVLEPLKVEVQQIFLNDVASSMGKSIEEVEQMLLKEKSSELEKYWKSIKPFSRSEHTGEMEKNAFLLQKEGDMSSVFEVKEGPTIIRLVRRIARTYKPLVNVKDDITTILVNKAFKKEFVKDIKNIVSQKDSTAMEAFIAAKGGKKEVVSHIDKNETPLSQQLFSLKKGRYGFFVDGGVGVAVLLTDTVEKHLPDLKSMKEIVKNDFYEKKAKDALKSNLDSARKTATTKSFDDLRDTFNASLHYTDMIELQDQKKLQDLGKKGLPVHEMMNMEKEHSVISHEGERHSFLIKLNKIEDFDDDKFLNLKNDVKNHVGPIRMRLLLDGMVASLHRNATIETNELLFITSEDYSE